MIGNFGFCDQCSVEAILTKCPTCHEHLCIDCINQHDDTEDNEYVSIWDQEEEA